MPGVVLVTLCIASIALVSGWRVLATREFTIAGRRAELLDFLFRHQVRTEFQYAHRWDEGDVLVWDNLRTLHNAEADYRADEPRLIKRCQVMADRVFAPEFAHLAQKYGRQQ
jgi:Taurine catabolism dioxygenase TauD, TfdA family